MGSMAISVENNPRVTSTNPVAKERVLKSILRLQEWLLKNDYQGYDTFDGLNARYLRPFTFENPLLRTVLQQGIRRFPINLRPIAGVKKSRSTKGMGFIARGFMRLEDSTGDPSWGVKAKEALAWLIENQAPGYNGACWGNHFDYQSRSSYVTSDIPSIVWTSLIGHAFLDGYEHFQDETYLRVAVSACEHIQRDLGRHVEGDSVCLGYFPTSTHQVHNANTLGGSLLARTYSFTKEEKLRALAEQSLLYTAKYQRPDGSWYYGEESNLHWVDNFHTAYVLDCFKYYAEGTGSDRFAPQQKAGYKYWKETFFLPDGTPRYYCQKTLPLDIQCSSQAIDTLVFYRDQDPSSLDLALKVADWTIQNMQDRSGYFYYRRYPLGIVNKTPTLHWGQATMLSALSGLHRAL